MIRGSLFTRDFLQEGITDTSHWRAIGDDDLARFRQTLADIAGAFPISGSPNEATTEADLIFPVLRALGWTDFLPQQRAGRRREDVPDALLFVDAAAKSEANRERREEQRYRHGIAIVESKAWNLPLDRGPPDLFNQSAPSSQMLRYLSRAEIASERAIEWGILTNGRTWRLYYQGARSRSEEFLGIDLAAALRLPGIEPDLFAADAPPADHTVKLFLALFGRGAFVRRGDDARTYLVEALGLTREWEARVSDTLSETVFGDIYPRLIAALAHAAPRDTREPIALHLEQVKRSALTFLYRLLFVFYAEDRNLLPAHEHGYDDYSLRRLRAELRERVDRSDSFSRTADAIHSRLKTVFRLIDRGDASIGLPPYNGGSMNGAALSASQAAKAKPRKNSAAALRATVEEVLGEALSVADRERFLHWQVAFPGMWSDWESLEPTVFRSGQTDQTDIGEHQDPAFFPHPRYYVSSRDCSWPTELTWAVCFKDVTSVTNTRTMISAIIPYCGAGHTLPIVFPDSESKDKIEYYKSWAPVICANLNSISYDYLARQKILGNHLTWFIIEQIPVVQPKALDCRMGKTKIADFVRGEVLRLTYTAHDMAPFARDMGYDGAPFAWDEEDRRHRRARLDALFFHLYGINEEDAAYILDTFPIVREQDEAAFGRYRTKDLVLAYMRAVVAGDLATVVAG